jgi:hypothetical protein
MPFGSNTLYSHGLEPGSRLCGSGRRRVLMTATSSARHGLRRAITAPVRNHPQPGPSFRRRPRGTRCRTSNRCSHRPACTLVCRPSDVVDTRRYRPRRRNPGPPRSRSIRLPNTLYRHSRRNTPRHILFRLRLKRLQPLQRSDYCKCDYCNRRLGSARACTRSESRSMLRSHRHARTVRSPDSCSTRRRRTSDPGAHHTLAPRRTHPTFVQTRRLSLLRKRCRRSDCRNRTRARRWPCSSAGSRRRHLARLTRHSSPFLGTHRIVLRGIRQVLGSRKLGPKSQSHCCQHCQCQPCRCQRRRAHCRRHSLLATSGASRPGNRLRQARRNQQRKADEAMRCAFKAIV